MFVIIQQMFTSSFNQNLETKKTDNPPKERPNSYTNVRKEKR